MKKQSINIFTFFFIASGISLLYPAEQPQVAFTLSAEQYEKYPSLAAFIARYGVPDRYRPSITQLLTSPAGKKQLMYIGKLNDLPLYYKGTYCQRIIQARQMYNCIQTHSLDCLGVAEKYLMPTPTGCKIFAEAITGEPVTGSRRIGEKMAQQLITLARETGFRDWGVTNWIWPQGTNTMFCIDTGADSFDTSLWESLEALRTDWGKAFPKKTYGLLQEEIAQLAKRDRQISIKKYNDPDIDFDKVEQEWNDLSKTEIMANSNQVKE